MARSAIRAATGSVALLVATRTGHLGPTVFRSADFGRSWREAKRPPAFPKAKEGASGREVDHVFWLTPGHDSERGAWYAGTSPQGLFRSADGGERWDSVAGFNEHPMRDRWTGGELEDLERRYPGIRFRIVSEQDRIRRHIKIFVNRDLAAGLDTPLAANDEIMIVCALSGG